MKKIISLLITVITLTLLLCSCDKMAKEPVEEITAPVDEVALNMEAYLAKNSHDAGHYAVYHVEGKVVSENERVIRTWLVCYFDKDGDINWYIVTWDGKRYEKHAFQP